MLWIGIEWIGVPVRSIEWIGMLWIGIEWIGAPSSDSDIRVAASFDVALGFAQSSP